MASDTDNISEVLSIISQIESARASEECEKMTAAELMRRIAEHSSDDKHQQRLILYALAVQHNLAPTPERIESAQRQLESLGIGGFNSESLLAMYNDPVFAEFEKANAEWEKTFEALGQPVTDAPKRAWDDYERAWKNVRNLAIAAGSIAAQTEAPPFKSRQSETKPSVRPGRPRLTRRTATTRASGR